MHWYALHVRSQFEQMVTDRLSLEGIEAFSPTYTANSKTHGKPQILRRLFPGYVFGHFQYSERLPVISAPGVVSILGFGTAPAPMEDSEIEHVRKLALEPTVQPATLVHAGDRVVVTTGPLVGVEGVVIHLKGITRVVVSVTMLNRAISAEVDANWLSRVNAKAA